MSEISERKFNLREFKAIVHAISTYEDMELLLQHIVEGLCRTFKVKGSSILLYDEAEKQLFRVSSYGLSEEYIKKGTLYMDDEYQEFLKGRTIFLDDLSGNSRIQYAEAAANENITSILSVPIKYRNSVIGLLKTYQSEKIGINDEDLDTLNVLAQQLGVVIVLNGMENFLSKIKAAMEQLPAHVSKE